MDPMRLCPGYPEHNIVLPAGNPCRRLRRYTSRWSLLSGMLSRPAFSYDECCACNALIANVLCRAFRRLFKKCPFALQEMPFCTLKSILLKGKSY